MNPDAHSLDGLDLMSYGIDIAPKGWLSAADVLNALDAEQLAVYFGQRKK